MNFQKKFDLFFSLSRADSLSSCQKLNPGSLIHDHVSFPLCLNTDTLNTEFWEFDSELHSLGLSICVHIPNGYYVLMCSELVSLFRDSCLIFLGLGICSFGFSWQRDLALALCLLPLAFSFCCGMFFFPETCLHLSCLGELCDFSHPSPSGFAGTLTWLWSAQVTDIAGNGVSEKSCSQCSFFFFSSISFLKYPS